MGFELFCAVMIALLFSAVVAFYGYRMLIFLLPVWGFFFGFGLGAQSIQVLFGQGFLATTTSWIVGFVVALIFAVLSYLFYAVGVVLIAGALGYGVTVALLLAIGLNYGFIVWLIGIIAGVVLAVVTISFNLAKYVIIVATALGGSAVAVGVLMVGYVRASLTNVLENPVSFVLQEGGFLAILVFILMAVAGIYVQLRQNRDYTYEAWDTNL